MTKEGLKTNQSIKALKPSPTPSIWNVSKKSEQEKVFPLFAIQFVMQ